MALRNELEKQGRWLFKWRSYLPLLMLPILLIALRGSEYLERIAGSFAENIFDGFCIAISFLGLAIRCITVGYVPKGTSSRNTKGQKAKALNTTGMYSIIRHPLYFGNFIIFLGVTLFVEVWWFNLIAILAFWLYYERIILAEEKFLRQEFGDLYLKWAEKTPAFMLKFKTWKQPGLPFSFRNVLKREYASFFVIIASFTFLKIVGEIFAEGKLKLDLVWIIVFIVGLITYIILRTLKKKTKILDVEGR